VRHIIVDGYNVIRADARLQSLERVSLEHAREVLVRTLASSPRLANDDVVVVFDGARGTRSHVHGHRMGRIQLLYSARGQTADDVIIAHARSLAPGAHVVVVSNDVEVREHCRAEGCDISGSENLLGQIPGAVKTRPFAQVQDLESEMRGTLSTEKRGNPRRSSRKARRQRDFRF
jgi:predicted RNA-binding protein with PIN domain